eukprot:TRINITY_DN81010_c0_g1_i1.p1 TRINITY_DN81010_c0_g1~~TRINITY_DN81010_c0_g1_i1.p1  ORF type:complete len:408 (-),score=134.62 TRINITY_DN81010_c0_g1_i1:57-1280(-)
MAAPEPPAKKQRPQVPLFGAPGSPKKTEAVHNGAEKDAGNGPASKEPAKAESAKSSNGAMPPPALPVKKARAAAETPNGAMPPPALPVKKAKAAAPETPNGAAMAPPAPPTKKAKVPAEAPSGGAAAGGAGMAPPPPIPLKKAVPGATSASPASNGVSRSAAPGGATSSRAAAGLAADESAKKAAASSESSAGAAAASAETGGGGKPVAGSSPAAASSSAATTADAPPASSSAAATAAAAGDAAGKEEPPAIPQLGKAPKLSLPHNVYGFNELLKGDLGLGKKAIALRLEPMSASLPTFERVLSQERQNVVIGTNRKVVDITVNDEAVSKKHCTLALIGLKGELALCIIDSSTNGVWLNGERLPEKQKRYRVRSGDKLTLKGPSLDADFGWVCDFGNTTAYFSRGGI